MAGLKEGEREGKKAEGGELQRVETAIIKTKEAAGYASKDLKYWETIANSLASTPYNYDNMRSQQEQENKVFDEIHFYKNQFNEMSGELARLIAEKERLTDALTTSGGVETDSNQPMSR